MNNIFWEKHGAELISPFEPKNIQPNGLDLRLGELIIDYNNLGKIDSKRNIPSGKTIRMSSFEGFVLKPHSFYLGTTVEKVKIPSEYIGRVEGRSSMGRLGVTVHVTAGFIDTGFEGHITLELANLSGNEVVIYPNQRICQLIFESVASGGKLYDGKYNGQIHPQPSLMNVDDF